MLRALSVPAAAPNKLSFTSLCAPPPVVASRKLARLNTLNVCHSNFSFSCSVKLKFLAKAISASHCPGPTKVLRPKFPVKPRLGVVRTGNPLWLEAPQPLAHVLREKL